MSVIKHDAAPREGSSRSRMNRYREELARRAGGKKLDARGRPKAAMTRSFAALFRAYLAMLRPYLARRCLHLTGLGNLARAHPASGNQDRHRQRVRQ